MTITFHLDDGSILELPWSAGVSLLMACSRGGWDFFAKGEVN